jgi:hypothetical protein
MRPLNRIQPALPVQAYKTFEVRRPLATHFRPGTCAEADCPAYERGWTTNVDESTDLGQAQAHYIRKESGRRFREESHPEGMTAFVFEAGQKCFAEHRVPLDRPALYVVRGGDWRGNPLREFYQHSRPDFWVEDFALHQAGLRAVQDRG